MGYERTGRQNLFPCHGDVHYCLKRSLKGKAWSKGVYRDTWEIRRDDMVMDELKELSKNEHLPVFAFGPAWEMEDEPAGYRPTDFLPGAQSMVCFGIPLPCDVYQTPEWHVEAVWRSQSLLYRRLDTLSLRISTMLEAKGYRAMPTFGCAPLRLNQQGVITGLINQIRMAKIAGIGIIGKNGLLLHSRFGARLMLGGVITNAALELTQYGTSKETGCPPDCRICSDSCPAGSIMPEKKQVRIMRCLKYSARIPLMSTLRFLYLRSRNKKKAARYMNLRSFDEHTLHVCSRCVSLCPYGEEG